MNPVPANAFYMSSLGYRVFPVCGVDKQGRGVCFRQECSNSIGKHPLINGWREQATTDPERIEQWWGQWPWANLGIALGWGDLVIDVDPRNGGLDSLYTLQETYWELPNTVIVQTGSGGWHYYYKASVSISNGANVLGSGLDIKSLGGYVVGPGSRHLSGRQYQFEASSRNSVTEAPPWVLRLIRETQAKGKKRDHDQELGVAVEGERNSFIFSEALYHKIRSMSPERTLVYALAINRIYCEPPLDHSEVEQIVDSVYSHDRRG